jgi:hypothetical protein
MTRWDIRNRKNLNDKKIKSILNEVNRYFDFLYDINYQVQRADYYPEAFGNWNVVLASKECILEICKDRSEILVYFIPLNGDRRYKIGLKAMVYYLTQEQKFIGLFEGSLFWEKKRQFKELANLLKEYLSQSAPYFGNNFHEYREELLFTQRKHSELIRDQIGKKKKK